MENIKNKKIHKVPRYWSNNELAKFAHLFKGKVVNVSAWKDQDKQGKRYKDYFTNATEYFITNYKSGMRGISNLENEIFLNLAEKLPDELKFAFDVVFNHTTLEHIYNFHSALDTLVEMTKDIIILVVPFIQQVHVIPEINGKYNVEYGDFWRFTPQAIERLLLNRGMKIAFLSFNTNKRASVYIFCIATKNPEQWENIFPMAYSHYDNKAIKKVKQPWAGCNAFRMPFLIEVINETFKTILLLLNRIINFIIRKFKEFK